MTDIPPNAELTAWFEDIVRREAKNPEWQSYDFLPRMIDFAGYLCYKECRSTGMISLSVVRSRLSNPDAHFSKIIKRGFDDFVTHMIVKRQSEAKQN